MRYWQMRASKRHNTVLSFRTRTEKTINDANGTEARKRQNLFRDDLAWPRYEVLSSAHVCPMACTCRPGAARQLDFAERPRCRGAPQHSAHRKRRSRLARFGLH